MPYIGTQPKDVRSFGKVQFDFTATQGQTAFTGADDDGKTLGFTEGQIQVYVNGILMDASDYTTSNTNTVTLVSAANLNDIITVVALQTDIPNSDYVPISGGTFTGDVTFGGVTTHSNRIELNDNGNNTTDPNIFMGSTSDSIAKWGSIRMRSYDSDTETEGFGVVGAAVSSTSNDVRLGGGLAEENAATQIDFFTAANQSTRTGTLRMRINKDGIVTLPALPVASLSDTRTINLSNVDLTSSNFYNHTWVNQGNHFNATTGRFTCPVDGVYRIFWRHSEYNAANVRLRKNGSTINEAYSNLTAYNTASSEAIIECNANDYLHIQVASLEAIGGTQHKQCTFMLLG